MPEMTFIETINAALREEMARDKKVFIMGEDRLTWEYTLGWVMLSFFGGSGQRQDMIHKTRHETTRKAKNAARQDKTRQDKQGGTKQHRTRAPP